MSVRVNNPGRFSDRIKRVPRVRFYYGYDRPYMDMKVLAVYWTPRTPCQEGEEMYKHYIAFHWRPLFRFDWK